MNLQQTIGLVESGLNPAALRFEPGLFQSRPAWIENQLPAIVRANKCNLNTARMVACTSWGEYQILGANIYALKYTQGVSSFLASLPEQIAIFGAFVGGEGFSIGEDVTTWDQGRFDKFATFYNGPGDISAYGAAMKKAAGVS